MRILRTSSNILKIIDGDQEAYTFVTKSERKVTVMETGGINRNTITALLVEWFPWLVESSICWFEEERHAQENKVRKAGIKAA